MSSVLPAQPAADAAPPRRVPFPPGFPDVVIQQPWGSPIRSTQHPDYAAAKAGEREAAVRFVAAMLDPRKFDVLRALIRDRTPIVVAVHAEEATGRNAIPETYAVWLAGELGLVLDEDIVQANRPQRSGKDGEYRLAVRSVFDGPIQPGRDYLIADDNVTQGGTLADLYSYIENCGGHVIGATTLTGSRSSETLAPRSETLDALRTKFPGLEGKWQEAFGHDFSGLTQGEANYLLRSRPADALGDRVLARRQAGSAPEGGGNPGKDGGGEGEGRGRADRRGVAAGRRLAAFLRERSILVLALLLAALVGFIALIRPGTVTPEWVANTLLFAVPLGLMAGGETLLLLTGGIDLSIASVATGAAYLISSNAAPLGATVAVLLGLAVGLVVGVLNGIGVAVFRVQPLVMTLGTGLMTEGVLVVYSQKIIGQEQLVPPAVVALGSSKLFGLLPYDLFLWLPFALLLILGLRRSGFGRLLYAVGDNAAACRLAGVRVWRVLLAAYAACGLLSAVAGIVLVGTTNAADLSLANVYLLPAIAAAIIGGTSIFGGRGGYGGTIVGTLILTVLDSLLTLLNAPEPAKQILYGAVILVLAAAHTRLTD